MSTPNNKELAPHRKQVTRTHISASMYRGPIPPADELMKYEQVCHGAADRIIAMAEGQAKHRQSLEREVITSNVKHEKIGMILAFIITLVLILVGTYLIMNDKQAIGFLAIFVPSLFQAGSYIYIKYKEHQHANPKKTDKTS